MRKPTTLALGSYSSGTMRPEDLIPTFIGMLEGLRLTRAERDNLNMIRACHERGDHDDDTDASKMAADDDLNDLFDMAGNHVPDYCYFGSHEGDGADYGCWISHDSLEDDLRCGTVAPTREAAGDKNHKAYRACYAYEVNDHGNGTLWRAAGNRWVEVWSVV